MSLLKGKKLLPADTFDMKNHFYHIRRTPLSVTIFITHVRILRNWSYADVSACVLLNSFTRLCKNTRHSRAVLFLWILFVVCVSCHSVLSVPCSLVVTGKG